MQKGKFFVFAFVVLLLAIVASPTAASSFNVNVSDPNCDDVEGKPFCSIQAAINAAQPGDRIRVYGNGFDLEYNESVVIDKERLTLEGVDWPVIATYDSGAAGILIAADKVTVRKLAVGYNGAGIVAEGVEKVRIRENVVAFNLFFGIGAFEGQKNDVIKNDVFLNFGPGIFLGAEDKDRVHDNFSVENFYDGCRKPGSVEGAPEGTEGISPFCAPANLGAFGTFSREATLAQLKDAGAKQAAWTEAKAVAVNGATEGSEESALFTAYKDSPWSQRGVSLAPQKFGSSSSFFPPAGIILGYTSNTTVSRNVVGGNQDIGIVLFDGSHDNRVLSNFVVENYFGGIYLFDSWSNQVRGNELDYNMGWAGILVDFDSFENFLDGNLVVDQVDYAPAAGIWVQGSGNRVLSNEVFGTLGAGYVVTGLSNELKQNLAEDNILDGYYIEAQSIGDPDSPEELMPPTLVLGGNVLRQNRAINNGADGFDAEGAGDFFYNNVAEGNWGDGFELESLHVLESNVARDNNYGDGDDAGFDVQGSENELNKNEARENLGSGFIVSGVDNVLDKNHAYGNGVFGFDEQGSNVYQTNYCKSNGLGSSGGTCIGE